MKPDQIIPRRLRIPAWVPGISGWGDARFAGGADNLGQVALDAAAVCRGVSITDHSGNTKIDEEETL